MLKKIFGAPLIQITLLALLVLAGMLWSFGPLEHFENLNYDFWSARFRQPDNSSVAVVAIDTKSIRRMGDWPWPRNRIAEVVQLLSEHGAGAQGICLLYTQPSVSEGIKEIREIEDQIASPQWKEKSQNTRKLLRMLKQAQARLDPDAQLIAAIRRASNTVLPIRFTAEPSAQDGDDGPSGLMIINSLKAPQPSPGKEVTFLAEAGAISDGGRAARIAAKGAQQTFAELAGKAGGLGHLNLQPDPDGVVRRAQLLVNYQGRLYPAFSLQLALKTIDAHLKDISIQPDMFGRLRLSAKHLEISTDAVYGMLVNYDPRWTRERTYSFADVLDGAVDPGQFRNKLILIGITDRGLTPTYRVGSHSGVAAVEMAANLTARIISKVRLSRPAWAILLEIVALFYFAFFLVFVIPRVNIRLGGSILCIFLLTWYAMGVGLLLGYGYWIKLFGPAVLACAGFVIVQATIFSRKLRRERLESNKTIGLTYQGQGMLDMAYEKFMQCPLEDASVRNLLYNLGLDFERKRMFNKAVAIYHSILAVGPFKDIKERIKRLKFIENPLAMTATGGVGEATIQMEDTNTKPTFGRYEIIRELGHGAMGTVYLGRDPKINRTVAIKTLDYGDVDAGELEDVKVRFFREAEAAGKLSHSNIVSIYDLGEEHDMAYIAMELLTGTDLTRHCRQGDLLPMRRVLEIISEVTDALDYAHKQGVVHRDIKPGNIMLLEDGRVKVTDFGIARVVDASKTRTGVVMGTPSYMSPEQVAGKSVDGRSDIFTLGIVFYQLLTGDKPFKGENITAIMYAINNSAPPPLSEIKPDIPACVEAIIEKMLDKRLTKRFNSAAQLAKAIDECKKESW